MALEASADERETRGFISIRRSSRDAGLVGELDVGAPGRDSDRPGAREGGLAEALVLGVGKRLLRRDRPRVARVDAHGVEVLDRADDDAVPGRVGHDLELVLLPAAEEALDEDLADRARGEAVRGRRPQLVARVRDPAARSAERERGPDDRRQGESVRLGRGGDDDALRDLQARGGRGLAEDEAILGAADRVGVGADQLDAEPVEDAGVDELDGDVQRGLAAERRQESVGPLALDDRGDGLGVERLEVGRVGPLGVGHDRRGVRVDEDDAEALAAEHAARLSTGVVELARLADPDRAGSDDQDRAKVRAFRHESAIVSKKGRPSSGPGAASGWNWTLAKSSPARPSTVPSLSETCVTSASSPAATA